MKGVQTICILHVLRKTRRIRLAPFTQLFLGQTLSEKRFAEIYATAGLSSTTTSSRVLENLQKGLNEPGLSAGIGDPRLKLAAELYMASQFETSGNAKFLTLCTSLEVLAPRQERRERTRALIDGWLRSLPDNEKELEDDPEEVRALQSLRGGLRELKKKSIGASLEAYVRDTLSRDSQFQSHADVSARMVKKLYQQRGSVIHGGSTVEFDNLSELSLIVRRTLIAAIRAQPCECSSR